MADDNGAQQEAVTETQQEPMPSSEQQTPEPSEATQDVDASQVSEPAKSDEGLELPEDVKPRTAEQFDKLKKQLAEERQRRLQLEKSFQKPQTAPQSLPEWYDPTTGEVDVNKLQERERLLQQKLSYVEAQLQGVEKTTQATQEKEAFASYPQLDPNSEEYDDDLQEQVVSYMATAFAKGLNPTLKEAADKVTSIASKLASKAEKEGAKKALEQLSPKEQASLEATGRSDRRLPRVDFEQIRATTRQGGRDGIEAAMQRISKIKPVGQ